MGKADMGHLGVMPVLRTDLSLQVKAMQMPFGIIRYLLPPLTSSSPCPRSSPSVHAGFGRAPLLRVHGLGVRIWWAADVVVLAGGRPLGGKETLRASPGGIEGCSPHCEGNAMQRAVTAEVAQGLELTFHSVGEIPGWCFGKAQQGRSILGTRHPFLALPVPGGWGQQKIHGGFAALQYNPEENTHDTKPQENQ